MEKILTKKELAEWLRLSVRSIDRKVANRELPPPDRVAGVPRWRESVIEKWLADLDAAKGTQG